MTIDLDASSRSTCTRTPRSRAARVRTASAPEWREAAAAYFGESGLPTADDVAAYYRERKLAAVIFTVDAETQTGRPAVRNEEIAEVAAANADVLIPFASIDPGKGKRAASRTPGA